MPHSVNVSVYSRFILAYTRALDPLMTTNDYVQLQYMKASTCAHDRCALQQLALNVHVKHSDLT